MPNFVLKTTNFFSDMSDDETTTDVDVTDTEESTEFDENEESSIDSDNVDSEASTDFEEEETFRGNFNSYPLTAAALLSSTYDNGYVPEVTPFRTDEFNFVKKSIDGLTTDVSVTKEITETLKKDVAALKTAKDRTAEFKKLFGGEDNTEFGKKINVLMNAADEDLKELPGDSWVERTYNAAKSKIDNVVETAKDTAKSALTTLSGGYFKFDTATDHTTQPFLALIEKMLNTMIADHKEVEKLKKAQWSWSDYLKYGGGALLAGGAAGLAGRELGSLAYGGLKAAANYKSGGLLLGTPQPNQTGQDPEIASMQRQLREIEKQKLSQQIQNAQRIVNAPPSVPIRTAVATVPQPTFTPPTTTAVEPQPTISLSEPAPNPGKAITTELATTSEFDDP